MRRNRERERGIGRGRRLENGRGGIIKKKKKEGEREGVTADEEGEFSWKPW